MNEITSGSESHGVPGSSYGRPVTNADDLINSRDAIARIEELQDLLNDEEYGASPDEIDEHTALQRLAEQGEDAEDWHHGITLIRETAFVDYCRENLVTLPKDLPSYVVIDWDATARDLQSDYSEIEFDGVTYFHR